MMSAISNKTCRPRMIWAAIHKWGGIAFFGLFCLGAGNAAATAQFQVPWLQSRSAKLDHVEDRVIPGLISRIPVGTSIKSDVPTVVPDCTPKPTPKP
jgi:hypothetical protein